MIAPHTIPILKADIADLHAKLDALVSQILRTEGEPLALLCIKGANLASDLEASIYDLHNTTWDARCAAVDEQDRRNSILTRRVAA